MAPVRPGFVHVTRDPERAWEEIGPHVLYEAQTYAAFRFAGQPVPTIEDLEADPEIWVGTPEQIVEWAKGLPPPGAITFNPLAGGLPPDLAWESLELFAAEVQPRPRL